MVLKVSFWMLLILFASIFLLIYIPVRYWLKRKLEIRSSLGLHLVTMLIVTPVGYVLFVLTLVFSVAIGRVSCRHAWERYGNDGLNVRSVYLLDRDGIRNGTLVLNRMGWKQALTELFLYRSCNMSYLYWDGDTMHDWLDSCKKKGYFIGSPYIDVDITKTLYLFLRCRGGCAIILDSIDQQGIKFYEVLLVDKSCWGCVKGYMLPEDLHRVDSMGVDSVQEFKWEVYLAPEKGKLYLFGVHCYQIGKTRGMFWKLVEWMERVLGELVYG